MTHSNKLCGPRATVVTSPFSFYGAKSKIVRRYSFPKYARIIEPFAGSACYSFRHWKNDVHINDLDPRTYSIWQFLTSGDWALPFVELIPEAVIPGRRVSEIFDVPSLPPGFVELMRSFANVGTQGTSSVPDVITKFGADRWPPIRRNLKEVIRKVTHWTVSNLSYADLPNQDACWFIDPPYANAAGDRYRQGSSAIDFERLGAWCLERRGQIIVAENLGATWLPFQPLTTGRRGVQSDYQKSDVAEVVYEQSPFDLV
jgi:hypothetical protein